MTTTQTPNTVLNGIDRETLQALIGAVSDNPALGETHWNVVTRWQGGAQTESRIKRVTIGDAELERNWVVRTDEPLELAGTNQNINPQELLLSAVNACMTVGYSAVGALMGISIESLEIETQGEIDLRGFLGLDQSVPNGYPELRYTVRIKADATQEQLEELHDTVQATSPNFYNLTRSVPMQAELVIA